MLLLRFRFPPTLRAAIPLVLLLICRVVASTPENPAGGVYPGWTQADRGLPLLTTFEVPPTRHNGEVWSFAPEENGQLWVGSDDLSLFDGKTRERIDLPSATYAVRALARDPSGRVWLGAIGEIGYLERTAIGGWRYVSMREQLHASGITNLRDVWLASSTPSGMVFVTEQQIVRWNGSRFEGWSLATSNRLSANCDGETLWIFQNEKGLYRMGSEGPQLVLATAELPSMHIFWALSPDTQASSGKNVPQLVGTVDGVFRHEGRGWKKLARVSAAIAEKIPWRAVVLDSRTVAIGSYLGGLTIASINDDLIGQLGRANGLLQDSVTGLWFDETNRLWVGFPGGMARVEVGGLASSFGPLNGLSEPTLKVVPHRGQPVILTRRMLMRIEPREVGGFSRVTHFAHIPTPLSDVISQDGALRFSGYGGGIWELRDGAPKERASLPGYIFGMTPQGPTDELLLLRDTRLERLAADGSGGLVARTLAELGSYPINLVCDQAGDVWVSTVTNGIFRFRADRTQPQAPLRQVRHLQLGDGLPTDIERPQISTVGDSVFMFTERGIYRFTESTGAFIAAREFSPFTTLAAAPSNDPAIAYWLVRTASTNASTQPVLLRLRETGTSRGLEWESFEVPEISSAGRINAMSFTPEDGGVLWLAGSQSLLRLSVQQLVPTAPPPPVVLARVERNDRPIALPTDGQKISFDTDTTVLRVTLAGTQRTSGPDLLVQASLGGLSERWLKPQTEPVFVFTGLRPGNYTFRARAIDQLGRTGPTLAFSFVLPPPWYQRTGAIVGYVLLAGLIVFSGVRWRLRQLRRQNERLNTLVDERTRELARANLVKNEFLENISHEIRNPLNGIANLVDLLRDSPLAPEERRLADSLGRSSEHLKRVFEDVLGYTRLEYGHVQIDTAPFSLAQLLEDVVALHGVTARETKTDLSLHIADPFVDGFRGDAEKIRTIVSNYVGNALKYAPGAPVQIEVTVTALTPDDRALVRISVRDRGPGLSGEEQSQLFAKFSRGDRAKSSGISGTGLGLAICRGLAELMDGKAGVTSEPGEGAAFWVELPLERAPLPVTTPHRVEPTQEQPINARALIVDDQEYNQAVLRGMLRRLGFEADVASQADEVWPLIERHDYANIFLDWELPGLNGGEIACRLRTNTRTSEAVIIATTAHDNDAIRQRCLEAQMDGFVVKPFDAAKLRAILIAARARRNRHMGVSPVPIASSSDARNLDGAELNFDAFRYFREGDPAHAAEAVTLYLRTLEDEIAALRKAIDTSDREAIARTAHRVRSHASIVNGLGLGAAAQRVVDAARGTTAEDWRNLVAPVFSEADALRDAIISRQDRPTSNA